ncbi:hypothetical protein [Mocis latipes granulovirus]|uniref:Tlp20 n=1 Tax=Mocis latipes granulovirus TaxID=2072024 RepID=A0A161CD46_9BBAC|nr:hypothetical protein [Mocis latipes granulovirus]AKR17451.1 hypothetical protein [Mocis latipes granulovirus]
MTTSNIVDTDNILLYPILEDNCITLAVKEEYYLQKLGVGAYRVTVLNSDKLDHLRHTQHQIIMERPNCVLLHNCFSEGGVTAILVVTEPFKIEKNSVLCHIAFTHHKNIPVQVDVHREEKIEPDTTTTTNSTVSVEIKPAPRKPSVFDKFIE